MYRFYSFLILLTSALLFNNCNRLNSNIDLRSSTDETNLVLSKIEPTGKVEGGTYNTSSGAGFNTYLFTGYLKHLYGHQEQSATNITSITLEKASEVLSYFDGSSLHHMREGLELKSMFPRKGEVAHVEELVEILKLYQEKNYSLIIVFGKPFPQWMLRGFSRAWCPIPQSDEDWSLLKNDLSQSIGLLLKKLWDHPEMNREWLRSKVIVEPMNEFQSLGTVLEEGADCRGGYANGRRGADLDGGVRFVLNRYNVPMLVIMSSSFGVNWFKDYYRAGGVGQPNIHLYPRYVGNEPSSISAVDSYAQRVIDHLLDHRSVVPERFKNSFILGEFGLAEKTDKCDSTVREGGILSGSAHDQFLIRIFSNEQIKSMTEVRLIWKLSDVVPAPYNMNINACEATFGALDVSRNPKKQLLNYLLSVDGIDLKSASDEGESGNGNTNSNDPTLLEIDISRLFKDILYREPSPAELAFYVSKIQNEGKSLHQVEEELRSTTEGIIVSYYLIHLERAPKASGVKYWMADFYERGQSLEDIRNNFRRNPECKNDCIVSSGPEIDLQDCSLPWGGAVTSGSTVRAFLTSEVPFGQTCTFENRNCSNGVLTGSFINQTCRVLDKPISSEPLKYMATFGLDRFRFKYGYKDSSQGQPEGQTVHVNMNAPKGMFAYGPYINLKKGSYKAIFRIMVDVVDRNQGQQIAELDVVSNYGKSLHSIKTVYRRDFSQTYRYQDIELNFELTQNANNVEFRTKWKGTSYMRFMQVSVEEQ